MNTVGILAFGSLITDPGEEIVPMIALRIKTETPFPVEYARLSGTRGGAPTLVSHKSGKPVKAEILVLNESVSINEARNMLWRRERRKVGSGEKYVEGPPPNNVLVRTVTDNPFVEKLHYTEFHEEGKIAEPTAVDLAKRAIESVSNADPGMDGITYLMDAIEAGIETSLTDAYKAEVLRQTGAHSLTEAYSLAS